MKTKMLFLTMVTSLTLYSKVNAEKINGQGVMASSGETYKVNTKISSMEWIGKKVTGQHNGTIMLSGGEILVDKDAIVNGTFDIDMNSIVNVDMQGEYNEKLVGHLKSEDFFSVVKFPKAKFEIISTTPIKEGEYNYTIKGKLTIKGITNEINFPAMVKIKDGQLVGVGEVKVDRTKWDIKYGSKSFFENIGDKAIDNEFTLKLNIVAVK